MIAHRLTLQWSAASPAWGSPVSTTVDPEAQQHALSDPSGELLRVMLESPAVSAATREAVQQAQRDDLASSYDAAGMVWAGSGTAVLFGHSGEPVGRVFDPVPADDRWWTCTGWLFSEFVSEACNRLEVSPGLVIGEAEIVADALLKVSRSIVAELSLVPSAARLGSSVTIGPAQRVPYADWAAMTFGSGPRDRFRFVTDEAEQAIQAREERRRMALA